MTVELSPRHEWSMWLSYHEKWNVMKNYETQPLLYALFSCHMVSRCDSTCHTVWDHHHYQLHCGTGCTVLANIWSDLVHALRILYPGPDHIEITTLRWRVNDFMINYLPYIECLILLFVHSLTAKLDFQVHVGFSCSLFLSIKAFKISKVHASAFAILQRLLYAFWD